MACLCQGSSARRSAQGSLRKPLESPRAPFWAPPSQCRFLRRLPGISSHPQKGGYVAQHHQNRARVSAGMSALQAGQGRAAAMDTAGQQASRPMVEPRRTGFATRGDRRAACSAVRNPGADNRSSHVSNTRAHLGSGGSDARDNRPKPRGAGHHQQAPHNRSYQLSSSSGTRGSIPRGDDGACHRIRWQAREEYPQGYQTSRGAYWRSMQPARLPAHRGRDDGAGRCPHAEDSSISRPHHYSSDGTGVCPVQSKLHAGRERGFRLVNGTQEPREPLGRHFPNPLKPVEKWWWALRDLNPRHSRCKRTVPLQIWQRLHSEPRYLYIKQGVCAVCVLGGGTCCTARTSRQMGGYFVRS